LAPWSVSPGFAATRAAGLLPSNSSIIPGWRLAGLTVIHRHGRIAPGSNIVLVLAASPHRQAAFDAAAFVMDFLKTRAPFWKKEHLSQGGDGAWVSATDADDAAARRW
jgi:molybdopterin synthase catalytic subunit